MSTITADLVRAIEALLPALPTSWAGCQPDTYRGQPNECPCHMHVKRRALDQALAAAQEIFFRPCCGVYDRNAEHICTVYDAGPPCQTCGAPTVWVVLGAPGSGAGWTCRNNHFVGHARELTLTDVI